MAAERQALAAYQLMANVGESGESPGENGGSVTGMRWRK